MGGGIFIWIHLLFYLGISRPNGLLSLQSSAYTSFGHFIIYRY